MASGYEFDPARAEGLLKAKSEYIDSLHDLAQQHERVLIELDDDASTLSYISALHLNWLIAKFETFWFSAADTEIFVKEHWPHLPLFSPVDFELMTKHVVSVRTPRLF